MLSNLKVELAFRQEQLSEMIARRERGSVRLVRGDGLISLFTTYHANYLWCNFW